MLQSNIAIDMLWITQTIHKWKTGPENMPLLDFNKQDTWND